MSDLLIPKNLMSEDPAGNHTEDQREERPMSLDALYAAYEARDGHEHE